MSLDENEALRAFADRLGHSFSNLGILRNALTHRSLANERPTLAPVDNERLEFLGDAILGGVVAALLFEHFANASEGELTRRRADLVSEQGLCDVARELQLGRVLRLGKGEDRSGGRDKSRLLASALEGCIGAVYLDGGAQAAHAAVKSLIGPKLQAANAPGANDFKSRVQEKLQARGNAAPTYRVLKTDGPDHAKQFIVAIEVDGKQIAEGQGASKTEAQQNAAKEAFKVIEE